MRIILSLLIGLFSFFYLADLILRIFKKSIHGSIGLLLIVLGVLINALGAGLFPPPLNTLLLFFLLGGGLGVIFYHLLSRQYILSERLEKDFARKHEGAFIRLLEILPGALTWLAITSPIWLSFALPYAVAYLLILADTYWLFNSVKISILVIMGYRRMEKAKATDWLRALKKDFPKQWESYYHFLVIPTYKESLEVLLPALEAITKSDYPRKKIFIGLGCESRDDPDKVKQVSSYLEKLSKKISGAFVTIHPFGLPGEVPGPGTNRNFIINHSVKEFKKRGIKPSQVLVTTLDADFVIHPKFLAGALHKYLSEPEDKRDKESFTGVFLYNNNYWQAPTPMRLMAAGTAFWQLSEMVGSDKYINFASLSMNMQSLLDVGLWMKDKVNDDSGFYWKAYYHYRGEYKVVPHFLPISADAVLDTTLIKTFKNSYLQLKRWAYGVEHIPYIFTEYFKRTDMDFWDKTDKLTFILWQYFKWGTLALFIAFAGLLIPLINPHYSQTTLSVNLPTISSWILDGAFLGLFSTIFVHEKTVTPRPKNWNFFQHLWSYIQWALVPIILVTIATFPAIDAQTTLMFGKRFEFRVTTKARVTEA